MIQKSDSQEGFAYYFLRCRHSKEFKFWQLSSNSYETIIGPFPTEEFSDTKNDVFIDVGLFVLNNDERMAADRRVGRPRLGDLILYKTASDTRSATGGFFVSKRSLEGSIFECDIVDWPDNPDYGVVVVGSDHINKSILLST